ncbi:MAG: hypothetical protein NZ988_05875 [Thaumarchaeota archaeon]|nr:hypothetical protein [Candidatus Calditenuaceae archaeon]MDW8187551.1 hypothetical protein [Nitrososphaerota archaeon]
MSDASNAYESLLKALTEQRRSAKLVRIPPALSSMLRTRASQLRHSLRTVADRRSVAYKLREAELKALQLMVSNLLRARMRALISAAQSSTDPGDALPFEQSFYLELRMLFEEYLELVNLCSNSLDLSRDFTRRATITVVMLDDLPALVDLSGRKRGPFRRGSVATLPYEIASNLISSGKAKRIGSV